MNRFNLAQWSTIKIKTIRLYKITPNALHKYVSHSKQYTVTIRSISCNWASLQIIKHVIDPSLTDSSLWLSEEGSRPFRRKCFHEESQLRDSVSTGKSMNYLCDSKGKTELYTHREMEESFLDYRVHTDSTVINVTQRSMDF